jgi:hypothetical protein
MNKYEPLVSAGFADACEGVLERERPLLSDSSLLPG